MIKKCFSILFILCTSLSFAQNERYKLTFEIQDKVASKVFIFKQFGSSRDIVDSLIHVAGKSEIVFTNQPKGLYVLTYQYETSLQDDPQAIAEIDFIFHQNDIHFIIKHHDKNAFVDVITSEENKIWHQFKKAEAHRSDQVKYVFTTKNLFEDEKDIIKALRAKLKKENTEQKKTLKKTKNNYDKSFASKLIYHISHTVPPFEFDEDEIFPFVSKDLFERCAFDDENLLNANVYENIVFNYIISQYQKYSNRNEQEAAVLKSVEQIMLKAEKNEAIKNKMLDFIMNGLTQLKANVALNYLMEKYPDAEKCISQAEKTNHKIESEKTEDLEFEIVKPADLEKNVDDFFKNDVLPKNLIIYSSQENLHPFYQWSDVILNLSHPDRWIETFGLTIIEGMAYGLPAIVPPIGGILEVIEVGITGYAADSRDFIQLSKTLDELLSPINYARMSGAAIERLQLFKESTLTTQVGKIIDNA